MAVALRASKQGLEKVDLARKKKGWEATAFAWCDTAKTAPATLKRFRRGLPVQQEVFINICKAVGLNWEEIVDNNLSPTPSSQARWLLELSATLEEVDEQLLEAIVALVKQHSGDTSLKLQRIEKGSILLVFEGFQEGYERIEYLVKEKQLTELLGIPVEEVRLAPVNLSQWLQNNLAEAVEAGWQTLEEIFGTRTTIPAFRSSESAIVRRAKLIDFASLPDGQAVALIAALTSAQNQEISVRLQVYTVKNVTYLPENLALSVIYKTQTEKVQAGSEHNCLEMEFTGLPGEQFRVQLALGDISVTENFVI